MIKKLTTLIGAALLACGAYAQSTLNIITGTNVVIATTNIGGTNINMQISAVPGSGGASAYGPGITNASGVPAAALDAGANISLTTNGNRISIAASSIGAGSTNATDVGTNVVFKGDIQATNATVGSLTIVGTGSNVLNGEARITGNLRVVETNYAKAMVADYFSGPSTGQGLLAVKGLITSETNRNNVQVVSNNLTVGTTTVTDLSAFQPATAPLTNIGTTTTGLTNLIAQRQFGTAILTNISGTGALTNASAYQASSITLSNLAGTGALTNASAVQASSINLSNWSAITTASKQESNGNLTAWATITPASKQESNSVLGALVSSGVTFPASGIVSNAAQVKFSVTTKTVHSGAVTNFTLDVNQGRLVVFATNGATFTNFAGLEAGEGTIANYVDLTVVGCTSAVPLVTFPTLGGNSFGVHCWTNFGSPVVTYITNACRVRYGLEFLGTNLTIINCQTF